MYRRIVFRTAADDDDDDSVFTICYLIESMTLVSQWAARCELTNLLCVLLGCWSGGVDRHADADSGWPVKPAETAAIDWTKTAPAGH